MSRSERSWIDATRALCYAVSRRIPEPPQVRA